MTHTESPKRNLRRKEARPEEIVDSAMTLWARQGFAGTKIEDIAKGAGVAKGTVYLYFGSKEAIFEAAVKIRLAGTMTQIDATRKDELLSTKDLLQNFYSSVYQQLFGNGSAILMKVLLAEGHRFPSLANAYKSVVLSNGINTIANILRRGVERGELSALANTIDNRLVMAPVVMFTTWSMITGEQSETAYAKLIDDHIQILIKGLG